MPRYRFSWDNVPDKVVAALGDGLGLVEDPRDELRAWFGVRPKADFVEAAWPILLESWLANEAGARGEIVEQLSERGLGNSALLTSPLDAACQMAYLRSCRNAVTLRKVVLIEFHALGEPADVVSEATSSRPDLPPTQASSDSYSGSESEGDPPPTASGLSPDALKAWVLQSLASAFEREFEPDDDGDIPLWQGSSVSYVRVETDQPVISVFSRVVEGMHKDASIFEAVNQINLQLAYSKAVVVDDGSAVVIEASVPADSISASGLMELLKNVVLSADYFDTRLVARFGGRTAGSDEDSEAIDV
jgi:hypothetical protein